MELYEKIDNSTNKKKLSYKEKLSKKDNLEENNTMKYNIISVNLLKDKKGNQKVYGIDLLLKTTLYFLKKDNPLTKENFKRLEEIKSQIEKMDLNNEKEKREKLEEETYMLFKKISSENSLLSEIRNISDILEQAQFQYKKYVLLTCIQYISKYNLLIFFQLLRSKR